MNIYRGSGFIVGLVIGIVLLIVILRFSNTNHKAQTEYDERQKGIRGRAYQYGYYAMMLYEVVMILLNAFDVKLPAGSFILHFGAIFVGALVLGCYTVWKGAYWGQNSNRRKYGIVFIFLAMLNAIPLIGPLRNGTFLENGEISVPFVNLLVLIMLLVLGVMLLLRHFADQRNEED